MTTRELVLTFFIFLTIGLDVSCSKKSKNDDPPAMVPGTADGTTAEYANEAKWLCLPGRNDSCGSEPAAAELLADGSFRAVDPAPSPDESVDCFYVHPTSDLSVKAGNSENFEYLAPVEQLAKMQIAPFRSSCRIFAPLYRQVTIGTYVLPEAERQPFLDRAATDIRNAFDYYMANHNKGRKIVLIGHSQGSEMLSLLMKARFDLVPAMRSQLLLAILPGFSIHVPIGTTVGATFVNIPACTTAGEVGCVIAFRSYKSGTVYLGDGSISLLSQNEELCVNPATLDNPALSVDDRRTMRVPLNGTLLPPTDWVSNAVRLVESPSEFIVATATYSAACTSGLDPRHRYLAIEDNLPEGDPRHGLVLMDSEALSGITGLHTLDLQFPMAELKALVRARR